MATKCGVCGDCSETGQRYCGEPACPVYAPKTQTFIQRLLKERAQQDQAAADLAALDWANWGRSHDKMMNDFFKQLKASRGAGGKPHLRVVPSKTDQTRWECRSHSGKYTGNGYSPRQAYNKWLNAVTGRKNKV